MFINKSQLSPINDLSKMVIYLCSFFVVTACDPPSPPVSIRKADTGITNGELPEEFDASYLDAFMDMLIVDDPCDPNPCSLGAICQILASDQGNQYRCEAISCDDYQCPTDSRCEDSAEGAICIPVGCQGAEDCDTNEFCDTQGQCQIDICQVNERQCRGAQIFICNPDGSELIPWVSELIL